jgi:sigma-B regulation protein RsbU (phosphoserine phosphatase)
MNPILIIDDDLFMQALLEQVLQSQHYEVVTARNGEEGLLKAQTLRPSLIICDWLMPNMDGLEVCRRVKAMPELATTFFILLTSRSEVKDRVEGLDAGADDFLAKPIDASELKARVRAGLRLYQAAQELKQLAQDLHAQKQQLEAELAEAAEYVRSLLPSPITGSTSVDSQFLPSRQLGGDCFDYFWLDPDYLAIYLLDVSGHGLGAALPSAFVQNSLRSQALPDLNFYQPSSVLKTLNTIFQMDEQNSRYFTIWYGVYNRQKQVLTYSSAGHPPAILLTNLASGQATVKQLMTRGTPIGVFPDSQYFSETCSIELPSVLYIFSDGIYEFHRSNGKMGKLEDFPNVLAELNQSQIPSIKNALDYIQTLSLTGEFEDDCSLIQVKFGEHRV